MKQLLKLIQSLIAFAVFNTISMYSAEILTTGNLVEKQKSISGGWSIEKDGEYRYEILADDFKSKNGPDLKIFLSPISLSEVTGKTATKGSVMVAELKTTKGAQKYSIPDDIDLSKYKSLLIHCEKYSILWGGGAL